ncbi:pyridoxamine 5'-phosphate oxidase family protein [Microbacterium sp. cx-55]|uniref:pyridoxine/pyridoxamine 5'-phosphate oxidase n=1 Tax=Microbacterium sp. cx-55 TaxID=2875948 RepID=UPI001CBD27CA|nr:pyridoxamine 5'-phosphate oxidase family protein [Microbacterium sp. cx-55]MBZ4487010.1 pyridoxamine 5'-phosphate oxidase family protein [Microbacterium sp. cx-55]UGB35929.1 pyridoxamine 5'-phosphate oxidase family protein [Microbacterium sp. cx-55]
MDTPPGRLVIDVPIIDHQTDPVQSDDPVDDPLALAASWLPAAGADRMLMTLSTVDSDGFPRARTVMLSEFDGERFFFHTDAASRKVADLAADPKVALTLLWPGFTRQIVVQGTAEVAPEGEVADAYATRSAYLQQLAWLNTDAFAQHPRSVREERWAEFAVRHPAPAQPESWVGYAVTPHRLLFWVSNPRTASRRVEYTRGAAGWDRRYLPG